MKIKVFIILLNLLMGSQFINPQTKSGKLPVIDFSKDYKNKVQNIDDIADIEYIRLETTDDVLLNDIHLLTVAYASDAYIVIYEQLRGAVFVFNRNGKIVSHFNHRGGSGRGYPMISGGLAFDEKNEEIFVCFLTTIQVYSLNGQYKRTLKVDAGQQIYIYNFDDETLLMYDRVVVNNGVIIEKYTEKYPYRLVSKKDGSIVYVFDIHLPKRISNEGWMYPFSMCYGQDFMIADISSDTMFILTQNKEIIPLLVRKPSVHASEEQKKVWTTVFMSDKYLFFGIFDLNSKGGGLPSLMFEFETGETWKVKGRLPYSSPAMTHKNIAVDLMNVPGLIDAYKNKRLKGELEKLVETLDEEDNPIVRIAKFK